METNKGAKVSLNSIKSLFGDSLSLYQERFTVLSEIVLLPALIMILGYCLLYLGLPFSILGELVLVVGVIAVVFSQLALVFSIHNNAGPDNSYRETTRFFWPYIWLSVLTLFATLGGSVMLIIPGIWLAFALMLRPFTLVLENRKGIDALRQSKDYIKGYWWAVLGRTLLMGIIFVVISLIIRLPFALIGLTALGGIVSTTVTLFIVPFALIFLYKMYENLRNLKPEVADAPRASNTFIKVSAIIGVVALILIIGGAILAFTLLYKDGDLNNMYMNNPPGAPWQTLPSNN